MAKRVIVEQHVTPLLIFMGQSNCVGSEALIAGFQAPTLAEEPAILEWSYVARGADRADPFIRREWTALSPAPAGAIAVEGVAHGPELTCARRFLEAGHAPLVIKIAMGSTDLRDDWYPGSVATLGLWELAMDEIETALAALPTEHTEQLVAERLFPVVFWHQGERDAVLGGTYASTYEANLEDLIAETRTRLGYPGMPWVIGSLPTMSAGSYPSAPTVLAAQYAVAAADARVAICDVQDCAVEADQIHFTGRSVERIGNRDASHGLALLRRYGGLARPATGRFVRRDSGDLRGVAVSGFGSQARVLSEQDAEPRGSGTVQAFGALIIPRAVPSVQRVIFGHSDGIGTTKGWEILIHSDGKLWGILYDSGGVARLTPQYQVIAGDVDEPMTALAVHAGTSLRLFVNGVRVGTETVTGGGIAAPAATLRTTIGATSSGAQPCTDVDVLGAVYGTSDLTDPQAAAWDAECRRLQCVAPLPVGTAHRWHRWHGQSPWIDDVGGVVLHVDWPLVRTEVEL